MQKHNARLARLILTALGLILSGSVAAEEPVTFGQVVKEYARAIDRAKATGKPVQIEPEDSIDPVTPPVVPQVNPYTGHEINPYTGYDTSKKVSEPIVTLIPEDPIAAKLKFSDKTISYKKVFYLKGANLDYPLWIDENRYVANSYPPDYKETETLPKIVTVDVRTGAMEDTGYQGKIDCYKEGRIATTTISRRWFTHPDGRVLESVARYFGKLGEPLMEYPPYYVQGGSDLNTASCQLVPHWTPPKPQAGEPQLVKRIPLKVEHGAIMEWRPQGYPELRLGQDPNNYNKLTFNRTGSAVMLPLQAYWEQPSGKRVEIPLNPGEELTYAS